MAKYAKKSKLEFKNGSIVKKNAIVGIDVTVNYQYNDLENLLQRAVYLGEQPDYQPRPSLDGFEFKSIHDRSRFDVEKPETPIMDKKLEEAMQFYDEIEKLDEANDVNKIVQQFTALLDFCDNDEVVIFDTGNAFMQMFDGAMLGNPLELTVDKALHAMELIVASGLAWEKLLNEVRS